MQWWSYIVSTVFHWDYMVHSDFFLSSLGVCNSGSDWSAVGLVLGQEPSWWNYAVTWAIFSLTTMHYNNSPICIWSSHSQGDSLILRLRAIDEQCMCTLWHIWRLSHHTQTLNCWWCKLLSEPMNLLHIICREADYSTVIYA